LDPVSRFSISSDKHRRLNGGRAARRDVDAAGPWIGHGGGPISKRSITKCGSQTTPLSPNSHGDMAVNKNQEASSHGRDRTIALMGRE